MIDYHIHPGYSIDADDYTIDEYCQQALRIGLREICFTPHFECDSTRSYLDGFVRLNGQRVPMLGKWLDNYFYALQKSQAAYAPYGLTIKSGLEVGYDWGLESMIEQVVSQYPFDLVMGSVHCIDHIAISSQHESIQYFPNHALTTLVKKYFQVMLEGIRSGLFDVLGHLDLYRRYGLHFYGPAVWEIHREYIDAIFQALLQQNMAMEVNTSSLRQNQKEFYPSQRILQLARAASLNKITIGSDAHRISELGQGVDEARKLVESLGFQVTTYHQHQASPYNYVHIEKE